MGSSIGLQESVKGTKVMTAKSLTSTDYIIAVDPFSCPQLHPKESKASDAISKWYLYARSEHLAALKSRRLPKPGDRRRLESRIKINIEGLNVAPREYLHTTYR
jgi:hypothetical protein